MANDVYKRCNFCGKSEMKVKNMFTAGANNICDECVTYCYEMLYGPGVAKAEKKKAEKEAKKTGKTVEESMAGLPIVSDAENARRYVPSI